MKRLFVLTTLFAFYAGGISAQGFLKGGQVHGNFEIDAQYYQPDDKLGITDSSLAGKVYGMNAFGNLIYTNGGFSAGLRYEAYLPPLNGFDARYEGQGIPYWFAGYQGDKFEITVGHFYEQFGNGLVLRSYEEWALGYDNNFNGARIKYQPFDGVYLKALAGTQRFFWEPYEDDNRGIVKGFDAEFYLNDMIPGLREKKTRIVLGGSFVSKYEKAKTKSILVDTTRYVYEFPENVAAMAGRVNLIHGGFNLVGEYAYKMNDPSAMNGFIYKPGEALFTSLSYSQKGFGVTLSAKRIDNMSFKSGILEQSNALDINYLPPLTKQHLYSLPTLYPYATQPNGEMGVQAQLVYTIPRKSKIGGKYGTKIEVNYSKINALEKEAVEPGIPIDSTGTLGYRSNFFSFGELEYYEDLNIKLSRKFNSKFKASVSYFNMKYNIDVIEGHPGEPMVYANIGVLDMTYKLDYTKSLRLELQGLFTEQDRGDWATVLLEYNVAPKWFFSIMDEYNYGNPDDDMQLHYYNAAVAYVLHSTRIALSYGRQREGLLCVGGVCRQVPASNGFTLNITSSF
ncbi:MAG: DUF6029 family protein [Bacteroidales bacterium]|nr:DUF6029 family protein [Bacteroidales bacterium]MCF8388514.1 DUF6029 family protein [Bacteroidales bacterium]MCF8399579.1 DUF6029 family protein [Bacteroidales bacterium]